MQGDARLAPRNKHRRFDVVWDAAAGCWAVVQSNIVVVDAFPSAPKRDVVKVARRRAREDCGTDPAIVFTHDRDGEIGKGGNAEASFRCDSKRRRG